MNLYLDESGECSFSPNSAFKHFLVTILSVDSSKINDVKKCIKRHNAKIIRSGWDKNEEIKAAKLILNKKFGPAPIKQVLNILTNIDTLEVSYIIINKDKITNPSFRNAPYGVGYNYFTGIILSEVIFGGGFHNIHLNFDRRNKETHHNKHFREYLETKIYGKALERNIPVKLSITANDSHKCHGLAAVDYFSWSIYRIFEYGDDSFFRLFTKKLKIRREWYT